jgi:hypothetical protein
MEDGVMGRGASEMKELAQRGGRREERPTGEKLNWRRRTCRRRMRLELHQSGTGICRHPGTQYIKIPRYPQISP